MANRVGKYTLLLNPRPGIQGYAAVVGKKEGEGPLARSFDKIHDDTSLGQQTWEKAESQLQAEAVELALAKANISPEGANYILAGDLLNQCISSTYGLRSFNIPLIGLFGACSTMALSLGMSALLVHTGLASACACVTSSHFCSAERQFRFPLEYGGQRTPTAQWTATAAGSAVVSGNEAPYVAGVMVGKIVDMGIKDANNMGAAMAGAAATTIMDFLNDTGKRPDDFDMILTGDLGAVGSELMLDLLKKEGMNLGTRHADCGLLIYDRSTQDVHAGGSGCGCSAAVLCSHIMSAIKNGGLKNVLFVGTGALMSPTSVQQGESIPSIAHAVWLSSSAQ
ncbi:MAG: stage V sporulation protein AD [Clostridiales bacterium]|nr:stage V sporulation protein AD [Clostridiales bacterium]